MKLDPNKARSRLPGPREAVAQPVPGITFECGICCTAVLLMTASAAQLWCHGAQMSVTRSVRCSEPVLASVAGGLTGGAIYMDLASSSILRCTRSGGGWPNSRAGELTQICTGCGWLDKAPSPHGPHLQSQIAGVKVAESPAPNIQYESHGGPCSQRRRRLPTQGCSWRAAMKTQQS